MNMSNERLKAYEYSNYPIDAGPVLDNLTLAARGTDVSRHNGGLGGVQSRTPLKPPDVIVL